MERQGFVYEVKIALKFSTEEVGLLIELAKSHYDGTCQAAGTSIAEGGFENGFIAQLRLFSSQHPVVWSSRQLDLTLKVLEPYAPSRADSQLARQLSAVLYEMFKAVQIRQQQLNGE
jgi:hypothetical protein